MHLIGFLFEVFLVKVHSLKMFLEELHIKLFFEKNTTIDFLILEVFFHIFKSVS